MKIYLYFTAYILLFCLACKNEGRNTSVYSKKAGKKIDANFSRYLSLLTNNCDSLCKLMEDWQYSPENTQFHLISDSEDDTIFVSSSELECWCMGGSCGTDIHIFQKGKDNSLKEWFHGCGIMGEVEDTIINGIKPFCYYVRGYEGGNLKIRISKSQDKLVFDTLQRGNVPYKILELVLNKDTNCVNNYYDCPQSQLELDTFSFDDTSKKLWIAKNTNHEYWLIELTEKQRIVNQFQEVMKFEVMNSLTNGKKDIIIHKPLTDQVWKWEKQTYKLISERSNE